MATDWAADVKKYVPNADDAAIAGIVRYCGIALRNRDSSLVSFSDKTETDRVRNNFLKKKLGLTQSDATLDKAIASVGEVMKADRTKNRVTVYYLLAAEFKKLGLFVKAPAKAATKAGSKTKAAGAAAAVAGAAVAAKAAAPKKAAKPAAAKKAEAKPAAKAAGAAGTVAAGAAVAGAAVAAVSGAAKDTAAKAADVVGDVTGAAVGAAGAAAGVAAGAAGAAVGAAGDAAGKAVDMAGNVAGAAVGAAGAAAGAAAGLASGAADKATALFSPGGQAAQSDDEGGGMGWLLWLIGLALAALLLWWLFGSHGKSDSAANGVSTEAASGTTASGSADASALASAPAEGTVQIPAGAGVTTEMRNGKPVVKVYFDTGKTDVAQAFAAAAGGLKSYLDANPGAKLAVSGYADPSGNAAFNEELSKKRAQAVQGELVKAGISADAAQLVKPASATDATVSKEAARRVEVTVQ